jgi:hypothetical protein
MQTETPKEETGTSLIKLNDLADNINNEFRNSNQLAVDAIRGGQAAVKAAIRAGGLLTKAKKIIEHGSWLKWLADNCPDISCDTAQRWMALAKTAHVRNLTEAKNISEAYRAIGIIEDREVEPKGIGTAPVDMIAQFIRKFDRLGPVIEVSGTIDPNGMSVEQRQRLLSKAQPMIEFVDRVKAVDEAKERGLEVA